MNRTQKSRQGLITHTPPEPAKVETDEDELRDIAQDLASVARSLKSETKNEDDRWWRFRRRRPYVNMSYYEREINQQINRITILQCTEHTMVSVGPDRMVAHCMHNRGHHGHHAAKITVHSAEVEMTWPPIREEDD